MKNIVIILFLVLTCVSCDKLLVNVDGYKAKIQGKWQLVPADTIYYNFQNNLFEYQVYLNKDSILGVYGYYTLYGDTAIYLELLQNGAYINYNKIYTGSLNVIGWDTVGTTDDGLLIIGRNYHIEGPDNNKLRLIYQTEDLLFEKF